MVLHIIKNDVFQVLTNDITMRTSLQSSVLIFFIFFDYAFGFFPPDCAKIHPDSANKIPVEMGKEFTATCILTQDDLYTSKDIVWSIGNVTLSRELYKIINKSAVSVTVKVSGDMKNPLKCTASTGTQSYSPSCMYGIYLDKGYPPIKPKNLTCVAVQDGDQLSPNLTCSWDPGTRNPLILTNYTLYAQTFEMLSSSSSKPLTSSLTVNLNTYPSHSSFTIGLRVTNALGSVTLEESIHESEVFVKPNPPLHVRLIPEDSFPRSLMLNWTHPITQQCLKLKYNIRYCIAGSSVWTEVPQNSTSAYIESFRLQFLQPYTDYVVQMRSIHHKGLGYWSDWTSNVTSRTPEAIPENGPDLWRVYGDKDSPVKLLWKDPVKSNGKILEYYLTIGENDTKRLGPLNEHLFHLKGETAVVKLKARNSVGVSPETTLVVTKSGLGFHRGVDQVLYSVSDGQLQVDWLPPPHPPKSISAYLLEWVSIPDKQRDWQRVSGIMNRTILKGNFKPFKRYNITVYPIYREKRHKSWVPGKGFTVQAYLQQGIPLKGPSVDVTETKKNSALLKWEEIPIDSQRGFLTNYTIFYKNGDKEQSIVVEPDVYSYKLTGLESESLFVVHVMASNKEGSINGSDASFYTKKYGDGEIEVIVVFVCLGFLFFIVFIMMFSLKHREVIKTHLWPHVPDPKHSTLANWSPDCTIKTDTPKEATLPDVSVVEVDVFDRKSLCEEDKTMLPLKKDKYFSEEHSSGIGGSSCMSSPRQSVSDSDEGDSGQTTASTVQYSSVVASGYKGQTPSLQAPVFVRSESTQPLLDCEEHQEHLLDSSSHPRNSYFKRGRDLEQLQPQEAEESSCFSSMEEEDTPTLTEDPPGPAPGYMPQQSGYRPQ
ncbi:hypothetical protein NFI96_033549 [Prochilodus magdalenae]|nr:hypothetical protein NFI96_033549 [Prochilodus magdalenae]